MSEAGEPLADTREMYMAHAMFRREFGLMPALVRGVPAGDRERAGIVAGHFDLVNTLLTHHHAGEDEHIWPRLLDRAPEDSGAVVEVLESQHGAIDKVDVELIGAFGAWRETGARDSGEALAALLDRLVALLTEHLTTEETRGLPLIEQYITAAEWVAMVQAEGAEVPPELGPLLFGLMMYEADPVLIDDIVGHMPPEFGSGLKPIAAQAFAAHSELIYGTATPPRGTA